MSLLESFKHLNNKPFVSPIYRIKGTYKIILLINKFKELYIRLNKKYLTLDNTINQKKNNNNNLVSNINTNVNVNVKKRKSPNDKAALYDVGYIKESENDKNKWIVRETKVGIKRWFKFNLGN